MRTLTWRSCSASFPRFLPPWSSPSCASLAAASSLHHTAWLSWRRKTRHAPHPRRALPPPARAPPPASTRPPPPFQTLTAQPLWHPRPLLATVRRPPWTDWRPACWTGVLPSPPTLPPPPPPRPTPRLRRPRGPRPRGRMAPCWGRGGGQRLPLVPCRHCCGVGRAVDRGCWCGHHADAWPACIHWRASVDGGQRLRWRRQRSAAPDRAPALRRRPALHL